MDDFILQEDGGEILQEDGGEILYNSDLSYQTIAPVATPVNHPEFIFIIKSITGEFIYSTRNWEFDEISREINGSMSVRIRTDQLTDDIANRITDEGNQVLIRVSTAFTASRGLDYFYGYIPSRTLNLNNGNKSVEIFAQGFASRLWDVNYRNGTTIAIDWTAGITASDLAKDVIDQVGAVDPNFPITYTADSVEDSIAVIKDTFVLMKASDVLSKVILFAYDPDFIWYWVVNGDNIFRLKKSSATADHQLVYRHTVLGFSRFGRDLQQGVNEVFIVYNGGANVTRVVDQDSIDRYGIRSFTTNETNVVDLDTATQIGNAYLASNTAPVTTITVTVSSDYPIETINPGQTCRIDNMPPDLAALINSKNIFITKTNYKAGKTVDLELAIKNPFIQNQIEAIRRRVEQESVSDIAATTYA